MAALYTSTFLPPSSFQCLCEKVYGVMMSTTTQLCYGITVCSTTDYTLAHYYRSMRYLILYCCFCCAFCSRRSGGLQATPCGVVVEKERAAMRVTLSLSPPLRLPGVISLITFLLPLHSSLVGIGEPCWLVLCLVCGVLLFYCTVLGFLVGLLGTILGNADTCDCWVLSSMRL